MSMMRAYVEDSLGLSNSNEVGLAKSFDKMKKSLAKVNLDPFRNVSTICKSPEQLSLITEAVKLGANESNMSAYKAEDINRLNTLYENVAKSILNESVSSVSNLSPIMMNSFGIQERALISAHLPRAVKQVVAKVDNFKLTERIPYIIDIAGTKKKFLDAFVPDAEGNSSSLSLKSKVVMSFVIPSADIDLYCGNIITKDGEGEPPEQVDDPDAPGYRPVVSTDEVFGLDSALTSVTITGAKEVDGKYFTFGVDSLRTPNPEDGTFRVVVDYTDNTTSEKRSGIIQGQFDLSNGKLVSISTTNPAITEAKFTMVLSPETHREALTVSYDMKHTPVNIPVGEHFEYSLTEEFKDASDKYYNTDAMALLADYMGKAVEQVKDINTLEKYQELAETAVINTTFNCEPVNPFAQGKEEYIRREFHPFIEKVCIILKNKVRIPQCHFRVLGNPLDIRLPASAGVEYIYKRNEQFAGEINIDYEFSVTSDVHKIFYLSSERVPAGKLFVFLIPNTIENNISTVNHYEYATYVSNKYRGTRSNAPTVMISTRYLTKEYYPVLAVINIVNNLMNDDDTTKTGINLADSIYKKVEYVYNTPERNQVTTTD